MKIYLASSFFLTKRVEEFKEILEQNGHEITSKWWHIDHKELFKDMSDNEWYERIVVIYDRACESVKRADILILVAPEREPMTYNGANVELGVALALNKRVLAYGKIGRSAMYYPVERYETVDEILTVIGKEE